jgi:two-component system sensor histidine kinase RpfC
MTNLLQTTKLNAEQREYVDSIGSSAEVLRALIGDVLDLSKIEAQKLHLESLPFDLRAGMQEVCAALENQALGKGLELILQIDPRIPEKLIGDQLRVRQILFNLVGNAVKFTDQGEVRVRASPCASDTILPRPHLLLEVEDTGVGIPEKKLDEIFDSFWQADDSTTRQYGGTGLGTTIARDLTRLMGGRIGVESEVGRGSRFWVRLPLQQEPRPAVAEAGSRRLEGLRALVFENNATSRRMVMDICSAEGMACQPVLDIGHLSRMAGQTREVDLLIIADSPQQQDLGALLDLFHRVLGDRVPCLLLTYGARRMDRSTGGMNCLNKPFLAEGLVAQIMRLLGREPAADAGGCADLASPSTTAVLEGVRILVAEDNEIAGKVIRRLLEKQGLRVTLVRDGEEALARARGEDFAMAFVDLQMPKLDGLGLARAYRSGEESGERMPIIALTANAAEEIREECLTAGMDDFLCKPVHPEALRQLTLRYVGEREGV